MPRSRHPYSTEFREQLVALARAGRSVEILAREYESYAATTHDWAKQACADEGERDDFPTGAELEDLRQLRKDVRHFGRSGTSYQRGANDCATGSSIHWRRLVCTKRRDIAEGEA